METLENRILEEQQAKEFNNYHRLIKELVQPEKPDESIYADRQKAIIFELRNFKRYYPITYRTLKGLKEKWTDNPRLLDEINLTISFLENKVSTDELDK